jgi:MFS family permease
MFSVLHNKNFARLFYAGATSTAGFAIGQVAITWIVWVNTSSSLDVAYIGVSFIVASVIFSLAAGALVDRHERRRLMVLSDLVRAGTLAALVVFLLVFGFNLAAILLVAFVLGSFTTLFQPAQRALTPEVVGNDQIANANALVETSTSVIQFASNTAGGGIIVLTGVIAACGLNIVTFLISAALIAGIVGFSGRRLPVGDGTSTNRHSMVEDVREGFGYIGRNRALLELTLSAGIGNFFLSMVFQFFVVYADLMLKGGVLVYGTISGLFLLGWAPGAFISARYRTVRYAGRIWILGWIIVGACMVGLALLPYLIPALSLAFVMGLLLGLTNTTWLTAVQLIVPTEMQGRYFGLDQLGSRAVIPVGQVLGGVIIAASGVGVDFVIAGIGAAAGAGLFILSPYLRNLGWRSPDAPTTQ